LCLPAKARRNGVHHRFTVTDSLRKPAVPILIASALCLVWGAVLLYLAIVVLVPLFAGHGGALGGALFAVIVLVIAVLYGVTGYLIGQQRRTGARLGVIVAALTVPLQLVMHLDIRRTNLTPAWLLVDAAVLALVLSNWRRFDRIGPTVGA
jgi:hypothetical protein